MNSASPGVITDRRADLDSLRVLALLLLIVYHTLLVFDPAANWRVLSSNAAPWAGYLTAMLSPWRMPLVFFIGGCAARFMIERSSTPAFIGERASKLLTAFVFTVIVLAPLQGFVRRDDLGQPAISYLEYLLNWALRAENFHGLPLPDFAHAWFLPYLFVYSAVLALIWRLFPGSIGRTQTWIERSPLWVLVGVVMVWFAALMALVEPAHPQTSLLLDDVYGHLKFLPVFLLGACVGKSEVFQRKLKDAVLPLIGLAALLLVGDETLKWLNVQSDGGLGAFYQTLPILRGLFGAVALFAVAAFGAWALNTPSRLLTYASDAILPVYLLHQTVLVVAADAITPRGWPLVAELAILPTLTLLLPLAIYQVLIRHTAWLRMLFGLRPRIDARARPTRTSAPQPAGSGSSPG